MLLQYQICFDSHNGQIHEIYAKDQTIKAPKWGLLLFDQAKSS